MRLERFASLLLIVILTSCFQNQARGSAVGGNIGVDLWANSNCVKPGDIIKLRATATNLGNSVWTVTLKDEPVFDILIGSSRWSDGKPLTIDVTHVELKPRESKTIEMDWMVPKNVNQGQLGAEACFIYSPTSPGGPARAFVSINVFGSCPGLGP